MFSNKVTKSIFQMSRAFTPLLKRASQGNLNPSHIINVSSVAGNSDSSSPHDVAPSYAASKAAANKVTQILAAYLVKEHINVNCIAPAVFPSDMTYKYQLKNKNLATMTDKMHPGKIDPNFNHVFTYVLAFKPPTHLTKLFFDK